MEPGSAEIWGDHGPVVVVVVVVGGGGGGGGTIMLGDHSCWKLVRQKIQMASSPTLTAYELPFSSCHCKVKFESLAKHRSHTSSRRPTRVNSLTNSIQAVSSQGTILPSEATVRLGSARMLIIAWSRRTKTKGGSRIKSNTAL